MLAREEVDAARRALLARDFDFLPLPGGLLASDDVDEVAMESPGQAPSPSGKRTFLARPKSGPMNPK